MSPRSLKGTFSLEDPAVAEFKRRIETALADLAEVNAINGKLLTQIERLEHSRDSYKEALDLAETENETLRARVAELDTVAFPTMPLPDALQAGLLLDLTDQPRAPYSAVTHPEPIEWVDVVEPSKNGTQ